MSANGGRLVRRTAVLLAALGLPWIAGHAPQWVEHVYAGELFPRIAGLLAPMSRSVPFSLAEILVIALLGVTLLAGLRALARSANRGASPTASGSQSTSGWGDRLARAIRVAAVVVLVFHLLWGLNYARPPLRERLGWDEPARDAGLLRELIVRVGTEANLAYREALVRGEIDSATTVPGDSLPTAIGSRARHPREVIAQELALAHAGLAPRLARIDFAPPKFPRIASAAMTRGGIGGIYVPFTGEAHVNGDPPDAAIPFTMAHEMAHQRGVAREDEANFVAWLACRRCDSPVVRYSACLHAFGALVGAYWRVEPDSAVAVARSALDRGPRIDRRAIRDFWDRHDGTTAQVASRLNDAYLKTNAQSDGIASYGRMVDLLLACAQAGAWDAGSRVLEPSGDPPR